MKKLLICIVALLLVLTLGAAALATVSVQMTLTPDKTEVLRGETVTFTVSTAQMESCRSAGVAVFYDTSVFSFVEGKCLVSDADLSGFEVTNGIPSGVFAYGTAKPLAGEIFSFTLQAKKNAPLGASDVSVRVSARDLSGAVSCTAEPVQLTISCNHSWEKWNYTDDAGHNRICTSCKAEETAAHKWNEGVVTKEATCKEAGVKTYTCADCNGTKTEEIAKKEEHTFGAWTDAGDGNHKRVCTVCALEETAAHDWKEGVPVLQPTCTENGIAVYVCRDCNCTKTGEIEKLGHTFGAWSFADESVHKQTCTVCAKEVAAAHNWNEKETAAPTCAEAGWVLKVCTVCNGEKKETIPALGHDMVEIPAVAPTCTETGLTAGTYCQRCQMVGVAQNTVPALGHSYEDGVCTVCGATASVPGDLDGIEGTDEDDAVYLLQHVLMPELFPVAQKVDYDNNGEINEDDAVYLLQHILMPELFPL